MSYGQPNPYEQAPAQEAGHGYGQHNPYTQDNYELQNTSSYQNAGAAGATSSSSTQAPLSQQDFLARVQSLRNDITRLTGDIETIGQLHQRSLGAADPQADQQLEHYVAQTQIRNTAIKDGIKALERDLARTADASRKTKQTQLQSLRTFFKSELDSYQSIEREYRQKYRDQIARQYRIVNPDASEQEIQQAAEADWGNEGVFQTALRTNRSGHASSLLGNVRARHNELQRIEHTLTELAVLYQELATMVEQQESVIVDTENKGQDVVDNLESGNQQVAQANKSARNRRKLKWWCFFIVVLIIIAAVLGIALGITLTKKASGN
ncbi:hypothetical protein LLEC1_01811 [Akanthomyces lecanii]|uniref:t-SNARE coiled-coil homology domain-containing protein n=1 Tax=Cordyceps confragosa TaxID=2714763 RepID=A0A179I7I1_CORDF|nr:hypothetical protein LLEC1_01811 [Akanthomyces lecanii]